MSKTEPLVHCINLSKYFGMLPALREVSFDIAPGEVVGLAGRSGAGKSVLAQILAGLDTPTAGELILGGRHVRWPFRGRDVGIEVIHQRPVLVDELDIASNILLGEEAGWSLGRRGRWLKVPNQRSMEEIATGLLAQLDVRFPSLCTRAADLSSEERQMVAIARALAAPARFVVVDEPTVLLSYPNQQKVLALIQAWRARGVAVLFSSNNLDHLFAVADRIVVLRHGQLVADRRTDATSREEIVADLAGMTDQHQLTPLIWALDSYYHTREQADKLRQQQALLEQDLQARDSLNQLLIGQLAQQVATLDQANLALQDAQRRLLTEREQERKALARELHDQVIQDLLSINYELEELQADDAGGEAPNGLAELRTSIRSLVDEIRRICGNLRPPTIDSLGLGAALQSYTRDWSTRSGIPVTLDLDTGLRRLPEEIEISIFRTVQESLSNVRKHAHARNVTITLKHSSPRALMLAIADDGRGLPTDFDLASLPAEGHYGLLGISERIALLQGRLRLLNQADGGLLLQAEIPHPRVEVARDGSDGAAGNGTSAL